MIGNFICTINTIWETNGHNRPHLWGAHPMVSTSNDWLTPAASIAGLDPNIITVTVEVTPETLTAIENDNDYGPGAIMSSVEITE